MSLRKTFERIDSSGVSVITEAENLIVESFGEICERSVSISAEQHVDKQLQWFCCLS